MRDFLLFGVAPYLAAALLACVPVWRCLATPVRAPSLGGPPLWRWSLGLVLLGHVFAFLLPRPLLLWNRVPARLLVLEAGGFVLGLAALYRWGSDWYALSLLPWFRSLVAFRPDVSHVLALPPLVKLHLLAGIAAAAVLPFSSAVFALVRPAVRLGELIPVRLAAGLAELSMIGMMAILGLLLIGGLRRVGISQGYAPAQPIAFSHRLHAGTYHVPCLYCHFAAEKSRHAGIPPAGVCMSCHRQLKVATAELERLKESVSQARPIRWTKVHNLPDFVYFNHSQHVSSGVACQRCHGPVETMDRVRQVSPLTMGWCLGCHREAGPAARGGLDCGKCHY